MVLSRNNNNSSRVEYNSNRSYEKYNSVKYKVWVRFDGLVKQYSK